MKNQIFPLAICFAFAGILLYASPAGAQQYDFTLDFEDGNLRGWTPEGEAFRFQPTLGDNPMARDSRLRSNHQGRYWIGTFELYQGLRGQERGGAQGDRPAGTLTSASFVIPRGTLSFLIGGGSRFETRVELLVDDPIEGALRIKHATGADTETMRRESWDLTPYAGRTGRLRIVDASSEEWGHVNVDDFQFSSGRVTEARDLARLEAPMKIKPAREPEARTGPTAIIHPEHREVTRGEGAEFESRSSPPDAVIRETWTGPSGQTASGRRFTVNTTRIEPGSYEIGLSVIDRNKQTAEAVATLVVVPPPEAQPEVQPTARYRVKIAAFPERTEIGRGVRFIASLEPEFRGAEYNFNFGDGSPNVRTREPEIVHSYARPGEFSASVVARGGREVVARSDPIRVRVTEPSPAMAVVLHPSNENPFVDEGIVFRAEMSRPIPEARYQFSFGDSEVTDWTAEPEVEHTYRREGTYQAQVRVRVDRERPIESPPVAIRVQRRPQVGYAVRLRPDRSRAQPHTGVKFTAVLTPSDDAAEYNFLYGDGDESGWGEPAESVHAYARPGEYFARVVVRKNGEIIAESEGTTIAVLQPVRPGTETRVFLRVAPAVARTGDAVRFAVSVDPPRQGLEYRIAFGDGNERAWSSDPIAEHIYTRAGSYRSYATVRMGQRLVAESPPAEIEISAQPPPTPPEKPPTSPSLPLDPTLRTILIIGTAVVIFTAGYLARRHRRAKKRKELKEPVRTFQAEPHPTPGEQFIGSDQRLDLDYELQIRPVVDRGSQEIVAGGPLVADENHGSTEEK